MLRAYSDDHNDHRPHGSLGQQTPAEFYAGTKTNVDRADWLKHDMDQAALPV